MGFRDEEDALRAKASALEEELALKERELREKEHELEKLQRKLDDADEPAVPVPPRATPSRPPRGFLSRLWSGLVDLWDEGGMLAWIGGLFGLGVAAFGVFQSCGPTESPPSAGPVSSVMYVEAAHPGTVSSIEGAPPVAVGTACVVTVRSNEDVSVNCHATVECGGVPLYGLTEGTGFLRCTFTANKVPIGGMDDGTSVEDRDPELVLDLTHRWAQVRDGVGPSAWGVDITLGEGTTSRVGTP